MYKIETLHCLTSLSIEKFKIINLVPRSSSVKRLTFQNIKVRFDYEIKNTLYIRCELNFREMFKEKFSALCLARYRKPLGISNRAQFSSESAVK